MIPHDSIRYDPLYELSGLNVCVVVDRLRVRLYIVVDRLRVRLWNGVGFELEPIGVEEGPRQVFPLQKGCHFDD